MAPLYRPLFVVPLVRLPTDAVSIAVAAAAAASDGTATACSRRLYGPRARSVALAGACRLRRSTRRCGRGPRRWRGNVEERARAAAVTRVPAGGGGGSAAPPRRPPQAASLLATVAPRAFFFAQPHLAGRASGSDDVGDATAALAGGVLVVHPSRSATSSMHGVDHMVCVGHGWPRGGGSGSDGNDCGDGVVFGGGEWGVATGHDAGAAADPTWTVSAAASASMIGVTVALLRATGLPHGGRPEPHANTLRESHDSRRGARAG